MKDPGANPQPRWASFHLIFTQQPRHQATPILAVREADTAEAGREDGSEAPPLGPLVHAWPRDLCSSLTGLLPSVRAPPAPPGPRGRRPQSLRGRGASRRGCCVVAQAQSTGRKCAEPWLQREVRRRDMLLCLAGRHKERETTEDPTSLSAAL